MCGFWCVQLVGNTCLCCFLCPNASIHWIIDGDWLLTLNSYACSVVDDAWFAVCYSLLLFLRALFLISWDFCFLFWLLFLIYCVWVWYIRTENVYFNYAYWGCLEGAWGAIYSCPLPEQFRVCGFVCMWIIFLLREGSRWTMSRLMVVQSCGAFIVEGDVLWQPLTFDVGVFTH